MREIKFRAWDKVEKKWLYFNLYNVNLYQKELSNAVLDGLEFYLFTDLHDKNGKEIWEGDVVRHDNPAYFNGTESEDTIRLHRGGTAQVISVPFEFEFKEIDCGEWRFNGPEGREWEQFSIEVIGDIYNNPELLR